MVAGLSEVAFKVSHANPNQFYPYWYAAGLRWTGDVGRRGFEPSIHIKLESFGRVIALNDW
jgi:hypothetical protein